MPIGPLGRRTATAVAGPRVLGLHPLRTARAYCSEYTVTCAFEHTAGQFGLLREPEFAMSM